ncbi:MAG: MFS transporter [Oscillospiraceae bacterium]|nr:MFS transporter [Oscillospiraceae bacterium]MBR3952331.1 MFS transporter [Oscillospiraceae bacterium]
MIKKKISSGRMTAVFVAVCWMAYSFSYIGRLNFSASMAEMTHSGVLLKSEAGAVTTGFFICYGLGQFLSGWLGDKVPPRYLVFTGLTCSSLINLAISFAPPFALMVALWSANGISQALLWAPICKIVSDRVHSERRQKACIALATTMAGGTLFAYILSALLISAKGWQASFISGAVFTFGAALVWIIVTTRIEKKTDKNGIVEERPVFVDDSGEAVPHDEIPSNFIKLLLVSGLMTLAVASGVQGILKDCMSTWVPTFISDMFEMSAVVSILAGTLLPVFGLFGPLMANKIMMKTRDELSSLFILFVISSAALAMLALFGQFSIVISIVALAVTYACSLGQNMFIVGTIPMYFHNVGKVSMITGTLNAVSCLSTAVMSWVTGALVDTTGWGIVMTVWLILSVLAAVSVIFAKRRWNKFRRNLF